MSFLSADCGMSSLYNSNASRRVHEYDVYANKLSEVRPDVVKPDISVFQDLIRGELWPGTQRALSEAETSFGKLQYRAEEILSDIIYAVNLPKFQRDGCKSIPIESSSINLLIKYLVFLRFRNSPKYSEIVHRLFYDSDTKGRLDFTLFGHLFSQIRCMVFLKSIAKFLRSDSNKRPTTWDIEDPFKQGRSWQMPNVRADVIEEAINLYCWNVADGSNIVVGVTSDEKVEFLLSDGCYGTLDESFGLKVGDDNVDERDFFFPILPTVAVYILGTITRSSHPRPAEIVLDHESEIDVHLRNAMTLSAVPRMNRSSSSPKLYFSSLPSITRSISSYDEFRCRWIPELFVDYSRLKQRCRQKFLQETITKMLVIKGDIAVTDLTDDVTLIGRDAVGGGAFSDVWKGKWWDQVEGKERAVAVKLLRLVMVQNEKEKLFKRLHAEVLTWHYLCHRNVSQLYGIMQSETSVGMVSAWCEHGTIRHYLKSVNPKADRMKLMHQIASGVAYLHDFRPTIIHGDLKGSNILIDHQGYAIISDFGLSKVMSDFSASSFFAGSMRWMAPEIVRALVEVGSEATMPQVTTASDVYAFGSVCLEVVTGALPYAYRKHDPGVMFDIMAGVKPSRGSNMPDCKALRMLLNRCWNEAPALRPKMGDVLQCLTILNAEAGL
ncbi:kinase-like domain-containing protein [Desarmillaria tabescens]|uniref:Kinase-like domain-containing protein n=1 Tax=Armillaria tabescens TaxID=1929756 RepID=A0AA39JR29_ARMTA|nr:kinase-like domain-containing protein [Desarmillaria tabescens]KAK0447351.1 kinase-like domain-containing protein [Desarmillaria tabescens]